MRIKNISGERIFIAFYELGFYLDINEEKVIEQHKVINLDEFDYAVSHSIIGVLSWDKLPADRVSYNNSTSGLLATTVQTAVDELNDIKVDNKVAVDVAATADYLGNTSSDGVLRTNQTLTYTDNGDTIELGVSADLDDGYTFNSSKADKDQTIWGTDTINPLVKVDAGDTAVEIAGDVKLRCTKMILDDSDSTDTWHVGWRFRKVATNVPVSGTPITIYIIDPDVSASALPTGYDIRFTDSAGNEISYYRQAYSAGEGGFILDYTTETIYIYYGNSSALDVSTNTILSDYYVFYDFETGSLTTATDISGHGHTGDINGGTHIRNIGTGAGVYLNSEGAHQNYIKLSGNPDISMLTISCCIQPDHRNTSVIKRQIFSVGNWLPSAENEVVGVRLNENTNLVEVWSHGVKLIESIHSFLYKPVTTTVALTYDSNTLSLYLNGILEGNIPIILDTTTASVTCIGCKYINGTYVIPADEVAFDEFYIRLTVDSASDLAARHNILQDSVVWSAETESDSTDVPADTYITCDTQGPDELLFRVQGQEALRLTKDSSLVDASEWLQNGFVSNATNSISFDDPTRTFSITGTYEYYVEGIRYRGTGASIVLPNAYGVYVIYFDTDEVLHYKANPTKEEVYNGIMHHAFVSIVIWVPAQSEAIYVGNERHLCSMAPATHAYLHFTQGLKFIYGCALTNLVTEASGNLATSIQCGFTLGKVLDEDHPTYTDAIASTEGLPIYYMEGAEWRRTINPGYFVRTYDNTSSTRLAYNKITAGSGSLEEVSNDDFALIHVFGTTENTKPVLAVMGQNIYTRRSAAREGAKTEVLTLKLDQLLFPEVTPLYTFIVQTSSSYTNDVKSRFRKTDANEDVIDWRYTVVSPISISSDQTFLQSDGSVPLNGTLIQNGSKVLNAAVELADGESYEMEAPTVAGILDITDWAGDRIYGIEYHDTYIALTATGNAAIGNVAGKLCYVTSASARTVKNNTGATLTVIIRRTYL